MVNRSAPIARRTPLRSRTALPRATKPLPAHSAKALAARPARDACRAEVLARNAGRCVRCNACPATEVHELHRGQLRAVTYLNPSLCLGLCRDCHSWITTHPQAAHADGFAKWSWEYRP
jgi:hypothetical protein